MKKLLQFKSHLFILFILSSCSLASKLVDKDDVKIPSDLKNTTWVETSTPSKRIIFSNTHITFENILTPLGGLDRNKYKIPDGDPNTVFKSSSTPKKFSIIDDYDDFKELITLDYSTPKKMELLYYKDSDFTAQKDIYLKLSFQQQ